MNNNKFRNLFSKTLLAASILTFSLTSAASADVGTGDIIITLGENLTVEQKNNLLKEMNVTESEALIFYVSNKEEHDYLGKYMSATQIGTKALSSSKITIGSEGDGLTVTTKNINWVSQEMYRNALMTAGVTDADIYVTAPFSVSGTGALTGILKAYESTMDVEISEEQKEVANEELVKTAELGDSVGEQKATDLINLIKLKLGDIKNASEEDIRKVILESAKELGIELTDEEIQGLVDLFTKMKELDIDWNAIGNQLSEAKQKFQDFINDPETQTWIESIGDFFKNLFKAIGNLFDNLFGGDEEEIEVKDENTDVTN